jgi:hypothetical protein
MPVPPFCFLHPKEKPVNGKEWFELLGPTLLEMASIVAYSKYGTVPDADDRLGDLLVGMADAAYPDDASYIPAYPSHIKQLLDSGLVKPEQIKVQRERVVYNPYFAGGLCDRVGYFLIHVFTRGMIEARQQASIASAQEVTFTDLISSSAAEEDDDMGLEDRISLLDELFQEAQLVDRSDYEGSLWQTPDGDTLTLQEYVEWASERYKLELGQELTEERKQAMAQWLLSQSTATTAPLPAENPPGTALDNVRATRIYYGYMVNGRPEWKAAEVVPADEMRERVAAADRPYTWTNEDLMDAPFNTDGERQMDQDRIPVKIIEPQRLMELLNHVGLWEGMHPEFGDEPKAYELQALLTKAAVHLSSHFDIESSFPEIQWLNDVIAEMENINPEMMTEFMKETTRIQLAEWFGIDIDGSGYIDRAMTMQSAKVSARKTTQWFDKLIEADQMKPEQKEFLVALMEKGANLNKLLEEKRRATPQWYQ